VENAACSSYAPLQGHGDDGEGPGAAERRLEAFRRVTREAWLDQARAAWAVARRRADERDAPLLLAAYSLGAALGLDLASDPDGEVRFDGMLLFAPPLLTRWPTHALRILAPLPRLVIPSFAPPRFRANRGTPVAAYNALFASIDALGRRRLAGLDIPSLVVMDPRDELVSLRGLRRLRDRHRLSRWELHEVRRRLARGARDYHHLVVSRERLGPDRWSDVSRRAAAWLEGVAGAAVSSGSAAGASNPFRPS